MYVCSACQSVIERGINPSSPPFSFPVFFIHLYSPGLLQLILLMENSNRPPLLSLHLISHPVSYSLVLSLYFSLCLPPSHLPKYHKAFSPLFCCRCRWSIRWKGQREGWGWGGTRLREVRWKAVTDKEGRREMFFFSSDFPVFFHCLHIPPFHPPRLCNLLRPRRGKC